jgi:hypothetical protein
MYANRIISFGRRLHNRLSEDLLNGALDYIGHNEESLAFEILCDHIVEWEIKLSSEEFDEAVAIGLGMGFNLSNAPFKYLAPSKK